MAGSSDVVERKLSQALDVSELWTAWVLGESVGVQLRPLPQFQLFDHNLQGCKLRPSLGIRKLERR